MPLVASGPMLSGQSPVEPSPPLCTHSESDAQANVVAATSGELISWSIIGDVAIVLEYGSVYDVHTPLDPTRPIRSQAGTFHADHILRDLECFVDPAMYDFVLLYSLKEVPGWIHSGPRGIQTPAKNIGLPNSQFGLPGTFPAWPQLYLVPHMNSIELVVQNDPPDFGTSTAMHEMGHSWNVFWARQSSGPRDWQPSDPVAWLGACCSHWSWNWVDPQMPGMMYSAPTSPHFNEFDLYAMGLMQYAEAQTASYEVYEDTGAGPPGPAHTIGLDDLIFSLSLEGNVYYEGDGRRIPATDPGVAELTALIVVIRGTDEVVTPVHEAAIDGLAGTLPLAWLEATQGRSSLTITIHGSESLDADSDEILDCIDNCPTVANPSQQDADGDSMGDVCDPCPHVPHPSFWDLDHREGFNLHDFWVFQSCFSGDQLVAPNCSFADFSGGGQIDLTDYLPIGELMTGNCE